MIQLEEYYLSPDEYYPSFNYYEGLGLLDKDFQIEVHYTRSVVQIEFINKVLKEKSNKIYAIGEKGGLILKDDLTKLYGHLTFFEDN